MGRAVRPGALAARGLAERGLAALIGAATIWLAPSAVFAASPTATGQAVGDPRSSGQGPGLVGDPLTAILIVGAIALLALVTTLLYIRATGGPRRGTGR